MATRITILDYGVGNLRSVARAFAACGADVTLADTYGDAKKAERLVVPGVGAFGDCVARLRRHGYEDIIKRAVDKGTLTLGICVGMQMLFEWSDEFGGHPGLGLLPGHVQTIPIEGMNGLSRRVPHIGWTPIFRPPNAKHDLWLGGLLDGTPEGTNVYFVHSFNCVPSNSEDRFADAEYDGERISAAVRRDNLFGVQFHPEKSGPAGLAILRRFLAI